MHQNTNVPPPESYGAEVSGVEPDSRDSPPRDLTPSVDLYDGSTTLHGGGKTQTVATTVPDLGPEALQPVALASQPGAGPHPLAEHDELLRGVGGAGDMAEPYRSNTGPVADGAQVMYSPGTPAVHPRSDTTMRDSRYQAHVSYHVLDGFHQTPASRYVEDNESVIRNVDQNIPEEDRRSSAEFPYSRTMSVDSSSSEESQALATMPLHPKGQEHPKRSS